MMKRIAAILAAMLPLLSSCATQEERLSLSMVDSLRARPADERVRLMSSSFADLPWKLPARVGAMDVHKAIEDKLVVDVPGVDRVEDLVKDPAQYEGRKEYLFCGLCHLLLLARVWAVEVGLEG